MSQVAANRKSVDDPEQYFQNLCMQALEAHKDCATAFAEATTIQPSIGLNVWGPTQALLQQDVGRIERDLTKQDEEDYIALMEAGTPGFVLLPDEVTGKVHGKHGNLHWKPFPDMTLEMPRGQKLGRSICRRISFGAIYAQVKARLAAQDPEQDMTAFKAAQERMNMDLYENWTSAKLRGDGGLIPFMSFILARQYSTGRTDDEGITANRDGGINEQFVEYIEKRDPEEKIWTREDKDCILHSYKRQRACGANQQREVNAEGHAVGYRKLCMGDQGNERESRRKNEYEGAMNYELGFGLPFLPGKYLKAKGRPWRVFTQVFTKPVETAWRFVGGYHEVGKSLKWMWAHPIRTGLGALALGGLGLAGVGAVAGPGALLAMAGTAGSAALTAGGALVSATPAIIGGIGTAFTWGAAAFAFAVSPVGLLIGGGAIAAGLAYKLQPKGDVEMDKNEVNEKEKAARDAIRARVASASSIPKPRKKEGPEATLAGFGLKSLQSAWKQVQTAPDGMMERLSQWVKDQQNDEPRLGLDG